MDLTKQEYVDRVVVFANGLVKVYIKTDIFEGKNIISDANYQYFITPGDDYSQEDAKVQAICAAIQTPDVIAAYEASQTPVEE
jgi:hypothetical protein